ncbi:MAG: hypothetical protein AAFP17_13335 [Pseudomonadota bacterium]
MKSRAVTPLRTVVGRPIPLVAGAVSLHGPLAADLQVENPNSVDAIALPYGDFIPGALNLSTSSTTYVPGNGVGSMPAPRGLPFAPGTTPFLSLSWAGDILGPNISRELWFELEIDVPQSIALHNAATVGKERPIPEDIAIGGVCYGGWPYMPYYVSAQGENSANFGLPREARLTWSAGGDEGFVDAENAITRQAPCAHSAPHIFPCGPLRPGLLKLRFSDMPRAMLRLPPGGGALERWICIIPYLFLFEHRESVRYEPRTHAGLLGAWRAPLRRERTYASRLDPGSGDAAANIAPDMLLTTGSPLAYHPMTVASLFAEPRTFTSVDGDREFFLSDTMEKDEALWIVMEQTAETARCLAGLSIGHIKSAIEPVKSVEARVYELDPIDGVSPLDPAQRPDTEKYSTLIGRATLPTWAPEATLLRFQRPTRGRFIALQFIWRDGDPGRLAFDRLDLLQSAHVTLSPRRSRSQIVTALNFRLIGPDLAEDYATIGGARFSMMVDHLVAGETKETLLEASSLHDLARLPGVQVLANHRFLETLREVTDEDAVTSGESWEQRRSETASTGWRRSRTGDGTAWAQPAGGSLALRAATGAEDFHVEESGETRSKTEHLGFQSIVDQMRDSILAFGRIVMGPAWTLPDDVNAFFDEHTTAASLRDGWDDLWRCLAGSDARIGALLKVDGLRTLSLPPYAFPEESIEALSGMLSDPLSLTPDELGTLAASNPVIGPALAIQGVSFGANLGLSFNASGGTSLGPVSFNNGGGASAGISVSTSPQIPNMVRTSTSGATGAITYQASKQGCAYAQHRNDGFDDATVHVSHIANDDGVAGRLKRTVVRDLQRPGTRRRRQAGVNVHWLGRPVDIVSGTVPLAVALPATADKIYRTSDEAVRVRFPNGVGDLLVDVWFDVIEEVIRDDY